MDSIRLKLGMAEKTGFYTTVFEISSSPLQMSMFYTRKQSYFTYH